MKPKTLIRSTVSLILGLIIAFSSLCIFAVAENTEQFPDLSLDYKSALLMEAQTGKVLYSPPSVTTRPPTVRSR